MTLFSVARPAAFKVPRVRALPILFALTVVNRVVTHEREWWSAAVVSRAIRKLRPMEMWAYNDVARKGGLLTNGKRPLSFWG